MTEIHSLRHPTLYLAMSVPSMYLLCIGALDLVHRGQNRRVSCRKDTRTCRFRG